MTGLFSKPNFDSWTPQDRKDFSILVSMEIFKKFVRVLETDAQVSLAVLAHADLGTHEGLQNAAQAQGALKHKNFLLSLIEDLTKEDSEDGTRSSSPDSSSGSPAASAGTNGDPSSDQLASGVNLQQ